MIKEERKTDEDCSKERTVLSVTKKEGEAGNESPILWENFC
jgi:hypothetical protein